MIFWNSVAVPATQPLFYIHQYGFPYGQDQYTEVPKKIEISPIKVNGKITQEGSTSKNIKLQSNGNAFFDLFLGPDFAIFIE